MLDTEIKTEESKEANGISTQVEVKPTPVKPWIEAGFKSRAEMRAAKAKEAKDKVYAEGMGAVRDMANKAKGGKVKKPTNKPVKTTAAKASSATKPVKGKKPAKQKAKAVKQSVAKDERKTPTAPKKGMVKDGSQEPVALSELSARAKKVFLAVKKGATASLGDIIGKAFPSLSHAKASSTTRNQLRFLRVHSMFKLLGEGKYRRVV